MYAYYTFSLRYAEKSISKIYIKVQTDSVGGGGGGGKKGKESADRIERYRLSRNSYLHT